MGSHTLSVLILIPTPSRPSPFHTALIRAIQEHVQPEFPWAGALPVTAEGEMVSPRLSQKDPTVPGPPHSYAPAGPYCPDPSQQSRPSSSLASFLRRSAWAALVGVSASTISSGAG